MADRESTLGIEARLREDLKDATRARDQVRLDTIRMALAGFHNEEVARLRQALTEQDRIVILAKQIKQRQESAGIFRSGNRPELAAKEEREAQILQTYLPAMLTDAEVYNLVGQLVATHGKDFRAVMPLASRETRGRADGRRVQEIVRELTT